MAKLYTLDEKLLTGKPAVRVGDTCYPVDDRQKTVKKMMALVQNAEEADAPRAMDEALKLALGEKAFAALDEQNLPFAAYEQLFSLVVAAATGAEVEPDGRFCADKA